ncbi:MAG: hypothetical protein IJL98_03555, partial [Lachnospiraceae bacterium]|nr:hypothetical protein [Lachnospiraceae bacterium]
MKINEFKNRLASVTPEVPEHFHNRVEMTLENIVTQEAQMKESTKQAIRTAGRFSRRTLVIAIALILALGAIAFAATQWHLFERISLSYLTGKSPVNADSIMQRDVYTETVNDVEISIQEVGYDGRTLMMQYKYQIPDVDKHFGVTYREEYGDNIPEDYLEEAGGDPDAFIPGWGEEEMYDAMTAHHVGWWYDSIWINGLEVNAPGGSEQGMEGTMVPGEIICTLVWRMNNNGVIVNGPIEISLPIGDTSQARFPRDRDENGNSKKPEKGMITFTYDAGDIQAKVKTYHPNKEMVLPEVTAKVSEAAFSPLMTYITLNLEANPDAMAAFIEENGENVVDEDGTVLWPHEPMDMYESWVWSLELVDKDGKLIFPDKPGCEGVGNEYADFLYPYLD